MLGRSRHGRPVPVVVLATALAFMTVGPSAHAVETDAGDPVCDGEPATIIGTEGPDVLVGTDGPDVIVGLGGNDVIRGRGGDDRICGGAGYDHLFGGGGNDRVFGEADGDPYGDFLIDGRGDDYYDGGEGEKTDRLMYRRDRAGITADLQAGTVTGDFAGTDTFIEITVFKASPYDDTITGKTTYDWIEGRGGDDVIDGKSPNSDHVSGGRGADTISNVRFMYGERGNDTLRAGYWIVGGPGNDHLIGSTSFEYLFGEDGDDWLEGLAGSDKLVGAAGDDLLDGGSGEDKGNAGGGIDTCISIEAPRSCEQQPAPAPNATG